MNSPWENWKQILSRNKLTLTKKGAYHLQSDNSFHSIDCSATSHALVWSPPKLPSGSSWGSSAIEGVASGLGLWQWWLHLLPWRVRVVGGGSLVCSWGEIHCAATRSKVLGVAVLAISFIVLLLYCIRFELLLANIASSKHYKPKSIESIRCSFFLVFLNSKKYIFNIKVRSWRKEIFFWRYLFVVTSPHNFTPHYIWTWIC